MSDIPAGRPTPPHTTSSGPVPANPVDSPDAARPVHAGDYGGRTNRRPLGLGSVIGFFFGLMFVFVLAAAVAQLAVRGDRQVGEAPAAPAVTQDQAPAKPSPPADGNPAGSVSRDAVTP
jgi:hypothetical protein